MLRGTFPGEKVVIGTSSSAPPCLGIESLSPKGWPRVCPEWMILWPSPGVPYAPGALLTSCSCCHSARNTQQPVVQTQSLLGHLLSGAPQGRDLLVLLCSLVLASVLASDAEQMLRNVGWCLAPLSGPLRGPFLFPQGPFPQGLLHLQQFSWDTHLPVHEL